MCEVELQRLQMRFRNRGWSYLQYDVEVSSSVLLSPTNHVERERSIATAAFAVVKPDRSVTGLSIIFIMTFHSLRTPKPSLFDDQFYRHRCLNGYRAVAYRTSSGTCRPFPPTHHACPPPKFCRRRKQRSDRRHGPYSTCEQRQ